MNKLLIVALIAAVFFASMQAVGVALADTGQIAGCGAPAIFKSGIGLSIAAMWWIGEQVVPAF